MISEQSDQRLTTWAMMSCCNWRVQGAPAAEAAQEEWRGMQGSLEFGWLSAASPIQGIFYQVAFKQSSQQAHIMEVRQAESTAKNPFRCFLGLQPTSLWNRRL